MDVYRARTGKVAVLGVIDPFLVSDRANQLRNRKSRVCPPLSMCVTDKIDRHTVDLRKKVRAVVQVKTAEIVLIRFPFAAVLGNDEPGYCFQNLSGTQNGPRFQLRLMRT